MSPLVWRVSGQNFACDLQVSLRWCIDLDFSKYFRGRELWGSTFQFCCIIENNVMQFSNISVWNIAFFNYFQKREYIETVEFLIKVYIYLLYSHFLLVIAFFIFQYFEVPQTILDVALNQIKHIIIKYIINCDELKCKQYKCGLL